MFGISVSAQKENNALSIDGVYKLLNNQQINYGKVFEPKIVKRRVIDKKKKKELRVWMCDSTNEVYTFEYTGFEVKPNKNERNYVTIFGKRILIDSLFFDGKIPEDNTIMTPFFTVYNFSFLDKKYMALFSQNVRISTVMGNEILMLFDVTNKNNINLLLHTSQASEDITCFGDINNDNKLDYIDWAVGYEFKDTIFLYSLNDSTFIKDEEYYAPIHTGAEYYEFNIDYKRSKWAFKLMH